MAGDGYLQANDSLTVSAEPLLEVTLGRVVLTARQSVLCALQQVFKPPQQGSQHESLYQAAQGLGNDGVQTLEKARLVMTSSHRLMVDVRVSTVAVMLRQCCHSCGTLGGTAFCHEQATSHSLVGMS